MLDMSRIKVYGGAMPKYLTKISKFGGQYRLTIPKGMIEEINWQDVEYVILESYMGLAIRVRRFIDAESLGIKSERDRTGSD